MKKWDRKVDAGVLFFQILETGKTGRTGKTGKTGKTGRTGKTGGTGGTGTRLRFARAELRRGKRLGRLGGLEHGLTRTDTDGVAGGAGGTERTNTD